MDSNTFILLTSNTCTDVFPNNTNASFTNRLPYPLRSSSPGGRLYLRTHSVFLGSQLKGDGLIGGTVQIRIREVEDQRQGLSYERVSASLPYPIPESDLISATYAGHTFTHSPVLPARVDALNEVRVELTDRAGNVIDFELDIPTSVLVEATDSIMQEQFTITCVSQHPQLYPGNTLSEFTTPLPQEIQLLGYQVALLQIVYPPHLTDEEENVDLVLNGEILNWTLSDFNDTEEFLDAVRVAVNDSPKLKRDFQFGVVKGGRNKGMTILRRRVNNKNKAPFLLADVSQNFSKVCGRINAPRTETPLAPRDTIVFGPVTTANIYNAMPEPMAALHCNLVSPNVVGGAQAQALQPVPVLKEMLDVHPRVYEPKVLAWHDVTERPFNSIRFRFCNPDGSAKNFRTRHPKQPIVVNLVFKKKLKAPLGSPITVNMK